MAVDAQVQEVLDQYSKFGLPDISAADLSKVTFAGIGGVNGSTTASTRTGA
jgi:hypothetical protein